MERVMEIYDILDKMAPSDISFLAKRDPFGHLISVILSAQTTDKQVDKVAVELFSAYPDARALSIADMAEVQRIIKSTGFYINKAKNIVACSQELVRRYGGMVPSTIDELVLLPGVGRKTANCVVGRCFEQPAIIVDTHFGRVVRRLGLVDTDDPVKIELQIAALLDPSQWYRFSMTVNWYGRVCCHAKKPECSGCALWALCPWNDKVKY